MGSTPAGCKFPLMRPLSGFAQGSDNDFNLIRIAAAVCVLISHSYALTGRPEPLVESPHLPLGAVSVDIFFITSGFLVTASLLRRLDIEEFIFARAMRVFPALWVVLLLSVLVLGPALTEFPLSRYFSTPQTYIYPCRCATLFLGVSYTLPGVFTHNPFPGSVNGSLWTLTDEVRLYAILAVVWFLVRRNAAQTLSRFKAALGTLLVLSAVLTLAGEYTPLIRFLFVEHFFMFFTGAMFYVFWDRLVLSHRLFWLFAAGLLLTLHSPVFFVVYMCTATYVLLYLAYVPGGLLRKYNRLGDYSYGIYIYTFPVQQTLVALRPGISPLQMMAWTFPISLACAVLSWHLLEKRALGAKAYFKHYVTRYILLLSRT